MKRKHKSFREQYIECKKKGTNFHENCISCGHTLIMCKKYGGQCSSKKCFKERTSNNFLFHIFTKFRGINNITEPVKHGKPDEMVMLNVDIDEAGMIHRRDGYTLAKAGTKHKTPRQKLVKD